jgi:hypothetical protein|tara:strand:- start:1686 stop:2057 length:372 start_codon:yes stop_codon:yes gene_type:complete
MKKPNGFLIKSEGDCERVCKVFMQWLKDNSPELKQKQSITAPSEQWASFFAEIYEDELLNNSLEKLAEKNIIQVEFNIENKSSNDSLSAEDLLTMLQNFLDSLGNDETLEIDFFDDETEDTDE